MTRHANITFAWPHLYKHAGYETIALFLHVDIPKEERCSMSEVDVSGSMSIELHPRSLAFNQVWLPQHVYLNLGSMFFH